MTRAVPRLLLACILLIFSGCVTETIRRNEEIIRQQQKEIKRLKEEMRQNQEKKNVKALQ